MNESVKELAEVKNTDLEHWKYEQEKIRSKIITCDILDWQISREVTLVGGVDLSYVKGIENEACATLVICSLPDLNIVYEDTFMVTLVVPYIPGFLAFREAPAYISAIQRLMKNEPSLVPQCFFLDGNGTLHPRSCGLACHVGVLCDIPTIGAAKNLYQMEGLLRDEEHKRKIQTLTNVGDSFTLELNPGQTLGLALKTSKTSTKPMYVSSGHKISLETVAWLVLKCCKHRVPEPIRQADMRSREYLRKNYPGHGIEEQRVAA